MIEIKKWMKCLCNTRLRRMPAIGLKAGFDIAAGADRSRLQHRRHYRRIEVFGGNCILALPTSGKRITGIRAIAIAAGRFFLLLFSA